MKTEEEGKFRNYYADCLAKEVLESLDQIGETMFFLG